MKISVVIPVFNTAPKYIKQCLGSVFAQSYKPYEIIVVNDGSTRKETLLFLRELEKDKRVRLINQENKKISGALNTGIKNMKGEWWAGLSSDDMWLPNKLECQIDYAKNNPDAKVMYADWMMVNETIPLFNKTLPAWLLRILWRLGFLVREVKEQSFSNLHDQQRYLTHSYFATWSNLLIHKEVFDKVGLFNEEFPSCEDYEMNIRIAQHYLFHKVEKTLMRYRVHAGQLSNTEWGFEGGEGKEYQEKAKKLAQKLYG
ncbi:MAG: glycosyltransferase [archaeon]